MWPSNFPHCALCRSSVGWNFCIWSIGSETWTDLKNLIQKFPTTQLLENASFKSSFIVKHHHWIQNFQFWKGNIWLQYSKLFKSLGFAALIEFRDSDFSCPQCSDTPEYVVCDGKAMGPTKRKVDHISELDRHSLDNNVLPPGTEFADRVFISNTRERKWIK